MMKTSHIPPHARQAWICAPAARPSFAMAGASPGRRAPLFGIASGSHADASQWRADRALAALVSYA